MLFTIFPLHPISSADMVFAAGRLVGNIDWIRSLGYLQVWGFVVLGFFMLNGFT